MPYLLLALIFLLGIVLEATVFNFLPIAGVKPDLLLVVVIIFALLRGALPAAGLGLAYGLTEDLLGGKFIGLNALTKMLTGYLVGLLEPKIFKDHWIIPVLALFCGSLASQFIFLLVGWLVGATAELSAGFWQVALPLAVYNTCLAPLVSGSLRRPAAVRQFFRHLGSR